MRSSEINSKRQFYVCVCVCVKVSWLEESFLVVNLMRGNLETAINMKLSGKGTFIYHAEASIVFLEMPICLKGVQEACLESLLETMLISH